MDHSWLHTFCLTSLLLVGNPPLCAAAAVNKSAAIVDRLQSNVWLERQGTRQPLVAGMPLQNRDWVMTDAGARAQIRLSDGSVVALGSDTVLQINALGHREGGAFTAAFDIPQGALRFTTGPDTRVLQQRVINIRVGMITASLRGTADLWGSADLEGDRICLIEGGMAVLHPQGEAQQINTTRQCYGALKGSAPSPTTGASAQEFARWTALTEVPLPPPVTRPNSLGVVELTTVASESAALALYDRAQAAGYKVRIKPVAVPGGGYHYTLRVVPSLPSDDAIALMGRLASPTDRTVALPAPTP